METLLACSVPHTELGIDGADLDSFVLCIVFCVCVWGGGGEGGRGVSDLIGPGEGGLVLGGLYDLHGKQFFNTHHVRSLQGALLLLLKFISYVSEQYRRFSDSTLSKQNNFQTHGSVCWWAERLLGEREGEEGGETGRQNNNESFNEVQWLVRQRVQKRAHLEGTILPSVQTLFQSHCVTL